MREVHAEASTLRSFVLWADTGRFCRTYKDHDHTVALRSLNYFQDSNILPSFTPCPVFLALDPELLLLLVTDVDRPLF
jgi:hypothetical protein